MKFCWRQTDSENPSTLHPRGPQVKSSKCPNNSPTKKTWAHRGIPRVSCGGGLVLVTSKAGGLRGCSLLNSANTKTAKHTSYVSWTLQTLKQPHTLLMFHELCKHWNSQTHFLCFMNSANTETAKHTSYISRTLQTLKHLISYVSWTLQKLK